MAVPVVYQFLVPWRGIEPRLPTLEAQSLNQTGPSGQSLHVDPYLITSVL